MKKKVSKLNATAALGKDLPPPSIELPIPDEEWDFGRLPLDRVAEAFVYEYCRSDTRIKEAVARAVAVPESERSDRIPKAVFMSGN
jgi:hypothetical protein